jgi:hypothetical protein
MSLDTLSKYPVIDERRSIENEESSAINFANCHLVVGCNSDPINGYNGSRSAVKSQYPRYEVVENSDGTSPLTGDGGKTNNENFTCTGIEVY